MCFLKKLLVLFCFPSTETEKKKISGLLRMLNILGKLQLLLHLTISPMQSFYFDYGVLCLSERGFSGAKENKDGALLSGAKILGWLFFFFYLFLCK